MPKDLHLARQLRGEHNKTNFETVGQQQGFVTTEPKKKPVDPITTRTVAEEAHARAEAWRDSTRGGNRRKNKPAHKKPSTKKPAPKNSAQKKLAQKKPNQKKPTQKDAAAQQEDDAQQEEAGQQEEAAEEEDNIPTEEVSQPERCMAE
jgi:hypothetical protein